MQPTLVAKSPLLTFRNLPYADCIEACYETGSAAWISTDASLNEFDRVKLCGLISAALNLAQAGAETARTLIFQDQYTASEIQKQLEACLKTAQICKNECEKFVNEFEHCLILMKCCETCVKSCEKYLN